MDPRVLTVFQSPFGKVRLGQPYDGGYVIVDLPYVKYTTFLSGGISNDISFEEDFIKKYPRVRTFAFNGTIDNLPHENYKINFIKKNIGSVNNHETTNLHELINSNEGIFVKMDIEGGEIPWLKSLNEWQMNKVEQFVIEFHNPFTDTEIEVFDKLNKHHILVHFHGNNCCGVKLHRNVVIPNIFECTYLHKKYFTKGCFYNHSPIPTPLDMPNCPLAADIYIDYPPFMYKPRPRR